MDATFFLVAPFERVGRLHLRPLSPHGVWCLFVFLGFHRSIHWLFAFETQLLNPYGSRIQITT